jgi:prophage regulatory protein
MSHNLIRISDLEKKIGLSKSAIYARLSKKSPNFDPSFPRPIKLGGRATSPIAFVEEEVNQWIDALVSDSRKAA